MHYYTYNIGDYRKDTGYLSLLEHGIYRSLLDTYYLDEQPLCADVESLCRRHGARSNDERTAVKSVLADFFTRSDEGYSHNRCDDEIAKYHEKSAKAKVSAAASVEVRRAKKNPETSEGETIADGLLSERLTNVQRTFSDGSANHKPITNNQEPRTKEKIKVPRGPRFDAQAHLVSLGVDQNIAADWLKQRKAKPTETAIRGVQREATKAGASLEDALRMCCERGWQAFNAGWYANAMQQAAPNIGNGQPVKFFTQQERNRALSDANMREFIGEDSPGMNDDPFTDESGPYTIEMEPRA